VNCPRCGADSRVYDSRPGEHFTTQRKRVCTGPVPHRFATLEMHQAAACSAKQRLAVLAATIQRRVALWRRDREIAQSMHLGWKAIACRFGMETKSAVFLAAKRGRNQ
jgi:hypothetical protein